MLTHYLDDHQLSRNVYFECAIHLLFPSNALGQLLHMASDLNRRYMSELVCPNFYCEVLDLSCFYPKCFLVGLRR